MYHTEGYLDRQTYFTKGNIFSFALENGRKQCYFWCVIKEGEVSQLLKSWFYQELVHWLEKGASALRRELERLGGMLERNRDVLGLKNKPFLCLYYQRQVYTYGEDSHGICRYQGQRGMYLWMKGTKEDSCPRQQTDISREFFSYSGTIEENANRLQSAMLKAMSEGSLDQGFFFLWEDEYDF